MVSLLLFWTITLNFVVFRFHPCVPSYTFSTGSSAVLSTEQALKTVVLVDWPVSSHLLPVLSPFSQEGIPLYSWISSSARCWLPCTLAVVEQIPRELPSPSGGSRFMLPIKRRLSEPLGVYMHSLGMEATETFLWGLYALSVYSQALAIVDAGQASLRFCWGLILGWPSLGPMEELWAASE